MRVYLAGPINGCTDAECGEWRAQVKADCELRHMVFIDPLRRDYRGRESACYREVVDLDKRDVREADVVLVNYVKPSVGTSMEVLYAWTLGKPVLVWCAPGAALSPWLRYHSSALVHSMEDVRSKLLELQQ